VQAIMQGMLSSRPEFTRLEQSVLNAICEMHPKDRVALEAQLTTATFLRRENTGAGFYTYFTVQQRQGRVEGERLPHRASSESRRTQKRYGIYPVAQGRLRRLPRRLLSRRKHRGTRL
jgi:hypothetical protein